MEFNFDLGHIFKQEICVIGEDMLPEGGIPAISPSKSLGLAQQRIMEILDKMGEASARAQGQREFLPSYQNMLGVRVLHSTQSSRSSEIQTDIRN